MRFAEWIKCGMSHPTKFGLYDFMSIKISDLESLLRNSKAPYITIVKASFSAIRVNKAHSILWQEVSKFGITVAGNDVGCL